MVRSALAFIAVFAITCPVLTAQESAPPQATPANPQKDLPFPKDFEPARYLGMWYEAARFPTPVQPMGTLATAEYSQGKEQNEIIVKNTAYSAEGEKIVALEGKARLQDGDPPRLAVSFGPIVAKQPNYFVMHVDKDYQHAVVGTPNRKSLWILVRKVPVPEQTLKDLVEIAREAGFDTEKLVINQWKQPVSE